MCIGLIKDMQKYAINNIIYTKTMKYTLKKYFFFLNHINVIQTYYTK